MGKTSSAVKRRYNAKTYKAWSAAVKIADFEKYEALRGDMSRPEFLKMLVEYYYKDKAE